MAGLAAGLALTARMRAVPESAARDARGDEVVTLPPALAQAAQTPAPAAPTGPAAPSAPAGFPDFSKIAGQAVKGVANISSLQVVRTTNSPFTDDPFFR